MTMTNVDAKTISTVSKTDPIMSVMATLGGMHSTDVTSPAPGYFVGGLNVRKSLERITKDEWPQVGNMDGTGVVDSPGQFIEKFGQMLMEDPRILAVFLTPIVKAEQDPEGGWRWHKWGQYLGDKTPQHEYIYDEDDTIEQVFCFHIIETDY